MTPTFWKTRLRKRPTWLNTGGAFIDSTASANSGGKTCVGFDRDLNVGEEGLVDLAFPGCFGIWTTLDFEIASTIPQGRCFNRLAPFNGQRLAAIGSSSFGRTVSPWFWGIKFSREWRWRHQLAPRFHVRPSRHPDAELHCGGSAGQPDRCCRLCDPGNHRERRAF